MKVILENICAAFVITIILFFCVDIFGGDTRKGGGVVVEKVFKQEQDYVEYNSRTDANGKRYVSTDIRHVPASWIVYASIQSGQVVKVKCQAGIYYETRIGEEILIHTRYGLMTGWAWSRRAR